MSKLVVRRRREERTSRHESCDNKSVILLINSMGDGSRLYDCGRLVFRAHYWINTANEKSLVWYRKHYYRDPRSNDKDYSASVDDFYIRLSLEYPEVMQYFLFHPNELFGYQ